MTERSARKAPSPRAITVRVVHWNAVEGKRRAEALRKSGYRVETGPVDGQTLQRLRKRPPGVVVIDLSRLPMQGRDVGVALRHAAATRGISLVFADGDPVKVAKIREVLPDAVYTPWARIRSAVRRALARPPDSPVKPDSVFAGYAKTPLPRKLGIKEGSSVVLVGAPPDFERALGELPADVVIKRRAAGRSDLTLWFVTKERQIHQRLEKMKERAHNGGLWIVWPKRASAIASTLTQASVRKPAMAAGLVDFKVAAIDEDWTGLRFTIRPAK